MRRHLNAAQPRSGVRCTAAVAGVLVATLLGGSASPASAFAGSTSQAGQTRATPTSFRHAAASRPLIKHRGTDAQYFSPNGDRRRDRARIAFTLSKRAKVKAVVRADGVKIRGPVRLGELSKGRHVWKWDGRTNRGKAVPDGGYRVDLTATTGARRRTASSYGVVDTDRPVGRLVSTRPTVYPKARGVGDHVRLTWVLDGWNPWSEEFFPEGDQPAKVRIRIKSRAGEVVWRRTVRQDYTPTFDWYGKRHSRAQRAGRYVAHVTVTDEAGNRRRDAVDLSVSHEQLVEQTWTTTVPAGQASHYVPHFGGCNGCSETCAPVASERFTDGLSFRPCPRSVGWHTAGYYGADVPFPEAPVDSYRVTAMGGPTTPGGTDEGNLSGSTGSSDGSITGAWTPVHVTGHPFLPDQETPVTWTFTTHGSNSYDVATFTVEYRYYVPAR
jgi:hypothetical protein